MNEMLTRLESEKVEAHIFLNLHQWDRAAKQWSVKLCKTTDGVKLEVEAEGDHLEWALREAYTKFFGAVEHGVPDMAGPMIEHKSVTNDDDNGSDWW